MFRILSHRYLSGIIVPPGAPTPKMSFIPQPVNAINCSFDPIWVSIRDVFTGREFFIQADDEREAKQTLYDVWGLTYSENVYNTMVSSTLAQACAARGAREQDLVETTALMSSTKLYVHYKASSTARVRERDGETCMQCGCFYPMADVNMPGKKFKCYSCRAGI